MTKEAELSAQRVVGILLPSKKVDAVLDALAAESTRREVQAKAKLDWKRRQREVKQQQRRREQAMAGDRVNAGVKRVIAEQKAAAAAAAAVVAEEPMLNGEDQDDDDCGGVVVGGDEDDFVDHVGYSSDQDAA